MAIDNTPPRLRLIVTIGVIVVITLVGINFVLESYYAVMTDQARAEKLAPTTAKDDQHAAETAALSGAKVPMAQAMADLKGARAASIEPKPSDDVGAMTGWSKLPKQAPLPNVGGGMHAPDTNAVATDGGAAHADGGELATDAGVPAPAADAGAKGAAPAPAPAKDAGAHAPH